MEATLESLKVFDLADLKDSTSMKLKRLASEFEDSKRQSYAEHLEYTEYSACIMCVT